MKKCHVHEAEKEYFTQTRQSERRGIVEMSSGGDVVVIGAKKKEMLGDVCWRGSGRW